jgi:hypothetical protein
VGRPNRRPPPWEPEAWEPSPPQPAEFQTWAPDLPRPSRFVRLTDGTVYVLEGVKLAEFETWTVDPPRTWAKREPVEESWYLGPHVIPAIAKFFEPLVHTTVGPPFRKIVDNPPDWTALPRGRLPYNLGVIVLYGGAIELAPVVRALSSWDSSLPQPAEATVLVEGAPQPVCLSSWDSSLPQSATPTVLVEGEPQPVCLASWSSTDAFVTPPGSPATRGS